MCDVYKTCESCNSSSTVHYTGCHWCEFDNACHAVGDVIYGCAWGVNCYSIDNCQRMEPEPADAMSPPVGVTVLFVFVGLACCAGLTCCVFVSNRVKLAYLALLPEERVVGGGGEQEETTVVQRLFELKPFTSPFGGKKKRRSRAHISCLFRCCVYSYALALLALATGITGVLTMWPHYPTFNMCSDELQWTTIIEGMVVGQTKAR
ncbi:hypothetical protein TrRE_jg3886 [Triparma retinervis]|uniref:PSI domain-containing protein n=1 Tax=Triparma retinervis TaxID=2557542 RepID=A0A9W7KRZ7_9STRA|nr:hypothetical protein TrRE_jg3886 [Triparma retinervis]